jgi:hypothetical protein
MSSTRELYQASYRLQQAINLLKSYVDIVLDESSSRDTIVKETDIVVHSVLAALEKIRGTISKSATHLSPMTGVKTACDQDEVEHVREILGKNKKKRKSPDAQILDNYVSPDKSQAPPLNKRTRLPRQAKQADPTVRIDLPIPEDGHQYSKHEMCNALESLATGIYSKERGNAIKEMIRLNCVPYKKSMIYGMLTKWQNKELVLNDDWQGMRRKRILDKTGFNSIAEELQKHEGRAIKSKDICNAIIEHQKKKIIEAGHQPLNVPNEMKRTTMKAYQAKFALHPALSLTAKTIRKTDNRLIAEESILLLRST